MPKFKPVKFIVISCILCLGLMISLKHFPVFLIHYLYVVCIACSLIFTLDLWVIFVISNGKFINNKYLTAVADRLAAEPQLIDYIKAKINNSVFFVGRNRRTAESSYFNRFEIFTCNTTHLFPALTIDGLVNLKIYFVFLCVSTLISGTITLVVFKNKQTFFCIVRLFRVVYHVAFRMPYLFVHSTLTFAFLLLWWVYLMNVSVHLIAINKPIVDERGFVKYIFVSSKVTETLFAIFGLFCVYSYHFILYSHKYCITKLVTTYLFHRARHGNLSSPNRYSLTLAPVFELFKYHIGTIALGAVVIPLCEINLFLFEIIPIKLKNFDKSKNKFVDSCVKTLEYCKKVNSNTVICAAIYGHDFHDSTERAYNLLKKNSVHLLDLNHIIMLFMLALNSSLFLLSLVIVLCNFNLLFFPDRLPFELPATMLSILLFSLTLAQCTFGLVRCVMNVLIICYCDDLERNNGNDKPYYTSITIRNSISDYLSKVNILNNLKKLFSKTENEESKKNANWNANTNKKKKRSKNKPVGHLNIVETQMSVLESKQEVFLQEIDPEV